MIISNDRKNSEFVYTTLSEKILSIEKNAPILVAISGKDGSDYRKPDNLLQ